MTAPSTETMDTDRLRARAEAHGVTAEYWDAAGEHRLPPEPTLRAVLAAIGVDPDGTDDPPADGPWPPCLVVIAGRDLDWRPPGPAVVVLEVGIERSLPAVLGDLPLGYHRVRAASGEDSTRLIVVPERCYLPPRLDEGGRAWGWALQLYALRSSRSWGVGDLGDLARLAAHDPANAGFVLLNPLHAPRPTLPQEPSPYFTSTRLFESPLFLAVEEVPEVALLDEPERERLDELAAAGRALTHASRLDRDDAFRLKDEALRLLFAASLRDTERTRVFERWLADHPDALDYGAFCVLVQRLGGHWLDWPADVRHPAAPGVAHVRAEDAAEVRFHAWCQWVIDEQLAAVPPLPIGLIADLAVGTSAGGFDGWSLQDDHALAFAVGAPPDILGPRGQNWGLPPLLPQRLRAGGYEAFARIVRANMRGTAGLRIDHVMGLFRLFVIPRGADPAEGTYLRYPADDLIGILALESHRHRALVIGEDLGTVEEGVRETLARRRILSYRLAWFEDRQPEEYPRGAMAAVTTHDLPTVAGYFTGADLRHSVAIGALPAEREEGVARDEAHTRGRLRGQLAERGLMAHDEEDPVVIARALYALLAQSPAMLIAVTLDDVLGVLERPNVPGTVDEHPNWRLPLPALLDDLLADDPRLLAIGEALRCVR